MHWDAVEVKPEPHYLLFVRFKDGMAGRVQLRPEELTGALAPLRDEQFFERVFIDYGAVAWPGDPRCGKPGGIATDKRAKFRRSTLAREPGPQATAAPSARRIAGDDNSPWP